jgi:hypothetical protein
MRIRLKNKMSLLIKNWKPIRRKLPIRDPKTMLRKEKMKKEKMKI